MTAQEEGMIDDLVQRISSAPVADKDVEAERHLQQTLGNVPDALYILTQTVLVQQYGLTQAKAHIEALQGELAQQRRELSGAPAKSGSFLSRIFGTEESGKPQASTAGYQPVNYAPPAPGYPPPPQGAPVYAGGYAPSGYGPGFGSPGVFGAGGSGFMRGALQTAAGVAAGALVFEGMEDFFRGFGGGHGDRGFADETVSDTSYGEAGDGGGAGNRDLAGDDGGFYNPEHDASRNDPGDSGRGFADAGASGFEDNTDFGGDASGSDDSGSFDGGDTSDY